MTRAFLALEVPAAIKERLAAAQENLRRELPRARWTRPDGWHLTLKFLGEVAAPALDGLAAELAPGVRGLGTVNVHLGGSGFFPSPARPRVAWVGGAADGVESVVAAVERAAEGTGFPRERRPWSIHVTQARLKDRWPPAAVARILHHHASGRDRLAAQQRRRRGPAGRHRHGRRPRCRFGWPAASSLSCLALARRYRVVPS